MSTEQLVLQGELKGHNGWVTSIATHVDHADYVISASRDKSVIVWKIQRDQSTNTFAVPFKRLTGHNHFVQDLAVTVDNAKNLYALTGSWDGSLRLWDVKNGKCNVRFTGHSKDVLSVAFSADNCQIVSGSRDKTIKVWNSLGRCQYTLNNDGHKEWVSCVRFSPNTDAPTLVSAGWDNVVKVWDMQNFNLRYTLVGHAGYVNTVTVSPDGSLCASGGKDGTAMLWDINEGKHLYSLEAGEIINHLVFSPVRYWLCAATASSIYVWDLESKVCLDTVKLPEGPVGKKTLPTQCISLCWSPDGSILYAGYSDNVVRAYVVSNVQN